MMARYLLAGLALLATPIVADLFPDCVNGPLANNTVCDASASVADRAKALIAAFTLEEKFSLTGNTSPGVPRLGLFTYNWWQEALHGVAGSPGVNFADSGDFSHATSFPEPISMSSAFDDELIKAVATVISTEARAFNNANRSGLDYWTPNINPYKDPRWGRGLETPGEDPFHLKSYVKNLIAGLQGDESYLKIVATCKHFTAYDIENWHGNDRYGFNAVIDPQDLSEYYMQSFQQCARDSNVSSIMCSYNALNGVPTCADPYILQTILREHWGWESDGHYITSDCDAVQNIRLPHNYTSTPEAAVAAALTAGTDLDCGTYYPTNLPEAYAQGLFDESILDQALVRLYSALVRLGYFDPASATSYRSLSWSDVSTPSSGALALQAAEEGTVLLKNDGILPLSSSDTMTIALLGSWANATDQLQGNYQGVAPYLHSPLYALQQYPNINVLYGTAEDFPTTDDWPAALKMANQSDLIIYASGIDTSVESEGMDRESIVWTGGQIDLLSQLSSLGKSTIIAQYGDQLDDTLWLSSPTINAIVWGGYPGQDGGTALINTLMGKNAPAGRLPVTQYPADYVNQVPMTDMALRPNATSGNPGRTYMWYPTPVLPFGYGMHYTTFNTTLTPPTTSSTDISTLTSTCASTQPLDLCPYTTIPLIITNTGNTTSDYVALLFVSGQHGPQPYPIKRLAAYTRVKAIAPGSSQTASLNITLGSLARMDVMGNQVLYPGDYAFELDVDAQAVYNFTLSGGQGVLDQWPQYTV